MLLFYYYYYFFKNFCKISSLKYKGGNPKKYTKYKKIYIYICSVLLSTILVGYTGRSDLRNM
jgi:hypothetical protein